MKLCTFIVGGDTGMLHLAVAMNKRVLCLAPAFRPYPYQHKEWRITPPDDSNMAGITTAAVIEGCKQAFSE
jgi:ADP-heptose:LPS heptosyltransferase